jgi:hypothetical protein
MNKDITGWVIANLRRSYSNLPILAKVDMDKEKITLYISDINTGIYWKITDEQSLETDEDMKDFFIFISNQVKDFIG